jgi:CO dehydrogenase/acetyl-CoA synthase alpha subunit
MLGYGKNRRGIGQLSAVRFRSVGNPQVMAKVPGNEVIAEVDFGARNLTGLATHQELVLAPYLDNLQ